VSQDASLKNTLAILTLTALLSACANLSSSSIAKPNPGSTTAAKAVEEAPAAPINDNAVTEQDDPPVDPSLPSVQLTGELLYQILSSELAYKRGDWQSAYMTFMSVAQKTRDPRFAKRAVEIALKEEQLDQALTAIRLWHELAPNSEEATQYYLNLIVMNGDLVIAQPILEARLKKLSPNARPLEMFQTQRLLARANDKTAAFQMLEHILTPYFTTPEAHLALAEGALNNKDQARALQEARIALTTKPDSELAALALAQMTRDKSDAEKVLADFLATYPKSHDVRIAYASMLVEKKQYEKAQSQFELALQDKPENLTSLYALGILANQNKNPKAAEKYLTTYLDLLAQKPDERRDPGPALMTLAQIAEERNDFDAAIKWLEQIESGDIYFPAQLKQAQLIAKKGDLAGARKLLSELDADNEREQVAVITTEGQMLREASKMPDAFAVYQAGLKRFPKNTDLMYDYAMLAEKNNKLDIMESLLRKVITLTPDNQHAYNALGYSFAERNIRLPEAYKLIEKALQLAPEDPFIMDSMGWVQFRLGNLKEAESLLRRAYGLRPDPEIAVHLGEVLWVKGLKDDAQKLWRDVKTKDPKNDSLKNTLARFQVKL
jgi:tetratricopeptide (TPR) repeat protein